MGGGGKRFTLSTTSFDSRFAGVGLLQLRLKQTRKYGCSICQSPSGLFVLVTLLLIVLVSSTRPYSAVRIATVPRPVRPSHLPSVCVNSFSKINNRQSTLAIRHPELQPCVNSFSKIDNRQSTFLRPRQHAAQIFPRPHNVLPPKTENLPRPNYIVFHPDDRESRLANLETVHSLFF